MLGPTVAHIGPIFGNGRWVGVKANRCLSVLLFCAAHLWATSASSLQSAVVSRLGVIRAGGFECPLIGFVSTRYAVSLASHFEAKLASP